MRLFLLSLILPTLLLSDQGVYTLVISFDGFRYDYFDKAPTPNFDKFIKKGTKAESLIPVFPSLTFPNHYSDKHRILGNTFYSKKLNKIYSMRDSESVSDGTFYGAEPIWVTAEKNNINTATYFWIGSEAEINGYRPSIYKSYDGSTSFEARVDSIVTWFSYNQDRRPRIAMLYFSEPDYTGHKYGTATHKIVESIIEMDDLLGYTINKLSELDIYEQINIIIVSDHGMENTDIDRVILIDRYIDLSKFSISFGPTVTALNSVSSNKNKISELQEIEFLSIYSKNNIPNTYHYKNEDMPDYLLVAESGWFITTSDRLNKNEFPLGMHGYDPSLNNMHGIFIAKGPSFNKGITIESLNSINVYPLICKIHDIEPFKIEGYEINWDGDQIDKMIR